MRKYPDKVRAYARNRCNEPESYLALGMLGVSGERGVTLRNK
ncbi:hypothetical protein [Mangrovibacter phragmitis]